MPTWHAGRRKSLVSGPAVGMLVAASLSPPAGLAGMAAAIGRWDMIVAGVFLVLLQLLGINVAGSLVFRAFGLSAQGARYHRGEGWLFPLTLGVTAIALGGFLWWQFANSPSLQRASRTRRAEAVISRTVEASGLVYLVDADGRFARAPIPDQNTILAVLYVQRREGSTASDAEVRARLTTAVQAALAREGCPATPLVDVSVLQPPTRRE